MNVITFGTLPTSTNAESCWYWSGLTSFGWDHTYEVDMKFNTDSHHWASHTDSGCTYNYDLRAIATHETGHWMGLKDIYDSSHANLTMYGYAGQCESRDYTLALGDYKGIEWIYNP